MEMRLDTNDAKNDKNHYLDPNEVIPELKNYPKGA